VDACQFSYGSNESARGRSALLGVRLTLGFQGDAQGRVQLVHQIHVNNTP
jgi:ketosteroid isomerase-like protein